MVDTRPIPGKRPAPGILHGRPVDFPSWSRRAPTWPANSRTGHAVRLKCPARETAGPLARHADQGGHTHQIRMIRGRTWRVQAACWSQRMRLKLLLVFPFLVAACATQHVEEPSYSLQLSTGAFELREYAPTIVAETTVRGGASASRFE